MTDLDEATFRRELIERGAAAVVEFHAPWCPFGKLLGPKLRRVEARPGNHWLVGRLDVVAHAQLAKEIGVEFVPGLAVYHDGTRKGLWYGDPPMGAVFALLDGLAADGGGS